ncbi:hypothetical protein ASPTUDRAFT_841944 [Aspergillus tubingensis CBS 134.48]|uniref:Uncharacterized protein n=1 Tax=Aspergillus tubingensis (strain CBS 134.48) TaxID=767770 RepID=A0A1L9MT65_ASPTC|nr:hypothetical protein ASPTUDRAFT_841944 [Aspergillus tubingensis CBS 134.48]
MNRRLIELCMKFNGRHVNGIVNIPTLWSAASLFSRSAAQAQFSSRCLTASSLPAKSTCRSSIALPAVGFTSIFCACLLVLKCLKK